MSVPGPLPDRATGPACVPGEVIELDELVRRITAPNPSMMTGPGTNTYVVGAGSVAVVDPGPIELAHLGALRSAIAGREVKAVCVTHHHRDHAPGARALADELGCPVVGFGHAQLGVDVVAREASTCDVDGARLTAWHTPGHASDHLCWLVEPLGWLLTGDHLMQGSTVVIRPPDGDLAAYLASLRRVRDASGVTRLAPGHGRLLMDPSGAARDVISHREARGELVEAALRAQGACTAAQLRSRAYADVGAERDEVATASCWAHLLALSDEGTARREGSRDDPEAVFTPV